MVIIQHTNGLYHYIGQYLSVEKLLGIMKQICTPEFYSLLTYLNQICSNL